MMGDDIDIDLCLQHKEMSALESKKRQYYFGIILQKKASSHNIVRKIGDMLYKCDSLTSLFTIRSLKYNLSPKQKLFYVTEYY